MTELTYASPSASCLDQAESRERFLFFLDAYEQILVIQAENSKS